MYKIIKGKRYDTLTAALAGYFKNDRLYRKKTGEYFLYDGVKITPLPPLAAQKWVNDYLGAKTYNSFFGKPPENKVQIGTWIEQSVKDQADALRDKFTYKDIFMAGIAALNKKQ